MTVNISKQLLGMACIIAGAFIPLILCTLNWLPYGFDPPDSIPEAARVHPPHHPAAADGHGHQRAGERPGVVGSPRPWRDQPGATAPERRTLLTGAVGILLLFTYLVDFINSPSRISPTAALFIYALTSTVLLMEAA